MKVAFSRQVDYVPTWNGNRELPEEEQIKTVLRPLQMGDLITLMDTLQAAAGGDVDEKTLTATDPTSNMYQAKHLVEACGDLVPRYCEVSNLEDESGPVDAQSLTSFPYYLELSAELLAELGNISMPSEVEEKNSQPQPGTQDTTIQ